MKPFTITATGLALCAAAGLVLLSTGELRSDPAAAPARIDPHVTAPAEQLGAAYTAVAAHVMPSVVKVTSEMTADYSGAEDPTDGSPSHQLGTHALHARVRGLGSGMILDGKGHVLTNYHVVRNVSAIKVTLSDGRTFDAKVLGTDPQTDVAVLALAGTVPHDLPAVTFGDSDALKVGEVVLAIGAPFGLTKSVTDGIISATGRADIGLATYEDFLQTDAPVNPGNSGGPLVNMRGEVVGMNSAIASGVGQFGGISFAIPSNMIKTMVARLAAGKKIVRGTLGIGVQALTADLASHFGVPPGRGVLVAQVEPGSPAARAGLERGDVILSYAGRSADHDSGELRNLIAATAPGTPVVLEIVRDGKPMTFTVAIGEQAEPKPVARTREAEVSRPDELGLTVFTLTPGIAKRLGIGFVHGVIIAGVDEDGIGASAGLEIGDVILEVDRTPVASVGGLVHALARARGHNALLLIERRHATLYIALRW